MTLRRHLFANGLRATLLATGLALGMASVSGCPEQSDNQTSAPDAAFAPESDYATTGAVPVATFAPDVNTGGALDAIDAADEPDAADSTARDVPDAMDEPSTNGR